VESDRCPTATFILTAPLALRSGVADGERVTASATSDLTIHGVTNQVTIELEAELEGDSAVVVASAPVVLADYDIEVDTSSLSVDKGAQAIRNRLKTRPHSTVSRGWHSTWRADPIA
jgi:polyisoprenoid-binding protein YceI